MREERDSYESQYRSLLSKLTTMRATLGDRLRQDAEELDRRETQIETLTGQVSTLESTCSMLKDELVGANDEITRLSAEVDRARKDAPSSPSSSAGVGSGRERELLELVEQTKLDLHAWQTNALEERSKREDLEIRLAESQSDAEQAREASAHHRQIAERESASASNLSAVLSEFQATQESELSRALGDYKSQLLTLSTSLAEYKDRAELAEAKLQESTTLTSQSESLAAQVKEKNLLIGKLRHEAVILNEHLTEALRRLRNDQSDTNVDKRLVTNLLIQFVTTPRTDGKRWEMLNLIAGVLGWGDEEREQAGLQKSSSTASKGGIGLGKRRVSAGIPGAQGADESFSNLFVEFLLSEAERGKANEDDASLPPTPAAVPTRLLSPRPDPEPQEPSPAPGAGGLGSYFGLSRGTNRKQ